MFSIFCCCGGECDAHVYPDSHFPEQATQDSRVSEIANKYMADADSSEKGVETIFLSPV